MATIRISDEDYEFLKELQHELNTQTNDGNADPVYWGVMDTREVGVPDGCGDQRIYTGDGGTDTLEGTVAFVAEYLVDDEDMEAWNKVDKTDIDDVVMFCREKLGMPEVRIVDVEKKSEISRQTGAFLTKRACQQYVERYGYNHSNPRTYAMTAYRNFELERLLKILKTMVLTEEKIVNSKKSVDEAMAEVEEKAKVFTEAHKGEDSEKILAEMRGEEPVSESLNDYAKEILSWEDSNEEWDRLVIRKTAKHFTDWQKQKDINWLKSNVNCDIWIKAFIDSEDGELFLSAFEQNGDLEQFAKNEADKFASKEYEYHNDIRLLSKGFYWGCKAGANWQKEQLLAKAAVNGYIDAFPYAEGIKVMFDNKHQDLMDKFKVGDKVKLIIIKED